MTEVQDTVRRSRLTRAVPKSSAAELCGAGIPQPGWSACRFTGAWLIRGYQHPYCTGHTAARLWAIQAADEMHRQAQRKREQANR